MPRADALSHDGLLASRSCPAVFKVRQLPKQCPRRRHFGYATAALAVALVSRVQGGATNAATSGASLSDMSFERNSWISRNSCGNRTLSRLYEFLMTPLAALTTS